MAPTPVIHASIVILSLPTEEWAQNGRVSKCVLKFSNSLCWFGFRFKSYLYFASLHLLTRLFALVGLGWILRNFVLNPKSVFVFVFLQWFQIYDRLFLTHLAVSYTFDICCPIDIVSLWQILVFWRFTLFPSFKRFPNNGPYSSTQIGAQLQYLLFSFHLILAFRTRSLIHL